MIVQSSFCKITNVILIKIIKIRMITNHYELNIRGYRRITKVIKINKINKINQKYGSRSENRSCEGGITSNRRL